MDQCYNYLSRDSSCKEFSIEFSCVNPIQDSFPKPTLRFLSCNIKGVGEIAWNFLSFFYKAGWDEFIVNNKNFYFRQKVKM